MRFFLGKICQEWFAMPKPDAGVWCLFSSILALISGVVLAAACAIIAYVILPNYPTKTRPPNWTSFILGVVSFIALIAVLIFVEVVLCSVFKKRFFRTGAVGSSSSSTPIIKDRKHANYRTAESLSRNNSSRRHGQLFEDNLAYVDDQIDTGSPCASDGQVIDPPPALTRPSSFAESLYKSFKDIQLSHSKKEAKRLSKLGPKEFLESVDEEGYHFDNLTFGHTPHAENCACPTQEEEEIDVSDILKLRQRLDTFDRKILGVLDDSDEGKIEEEEEEDSGAVKVESPKNPLTKQDSLKELSQINPFDKYLSLVVVDEETDVFSAEEEPLPSSPFDKHTKPFAPESAESRKIDKY